MVKNYITRKKIPQSIIESTLIYICHSEQGKNLLNASVKQGFQIDHLLLVTNFLRSCGPLLKHLNDFLNPFVEKVK